MNYPRTADECEAKGFTQAWVMYTDMCDGLISVKPDTDLDGEFYAFDHESGQMIIVYGWLVELEPADTIEWEDWQ